MPRRSLLLLVLVNGCSFDADYGDTTFRCDETASCPAERVCWDGACIPLDEVPPDASPEPPGLLHHWPLDDEGGDAADVVGDADGVVVGGAARVAGQIGGALACDGDDDWVEIGGDKPVELGTAYTILAWVRPADGDPPDAGTIFYTQHGTNATLEIGTDDRVDGIAYGAYDPGWPGWVVEGDEILPADTWTHVVFRVDGTDLRLYVDAVLDAARTSEPPLTGSGNFEARLCARHPLDQTYPLRGDLDDVRVYGRALDSSEISFLFQAR